MKPAWYRSTDAPSFPKRSLRGFERFAVRLMHGLNTNAGIKDLGYPFMWYAVHGYVNLCAGRLYEPHHLERVHQLKAPKGLILVSNHRSFFDMYVTSDLLYGQAPHLMRRLFFPVRKDFFYDSPLGLFLNLTVSGGSMWPPIWRDERRRELNPVGFEQIAAVLDEGTVIGIHPEGKRSTLEDPWTQLDAKPGLGRLLRVCDPEVVVLPYFVLGLSNDVRVLISRNFRAPGQRGEPVRIRFGQPLKAGELLEQATGPDPLEISAPVMQEIARLAEEDRLDWQARPPEARIC